MPDFDLHQWFSDEELELCPSCGKRRALRSRTSDSLICFACDLVETHDDSPRVDEPQAEPRDP
jgi:hypothetical protein